MDTDWDADNYEFEAPERATAKGAVNKWEGEDEEEEVKDSWEDEDNEEEKKDSEKPPEAQSAASKKPKNNLKKIAQEKDRKLKEEIALKEEAQRAMKNLSPAELQAEKLRQRKLQEEAELELVKATYGVDDSPCGIDSANPSSKEDFDKLREAINNKVQDFSKSEHYVEFIADLVRNICINLPATELKKISTQVASLAIEKSKMDKAASGKKKGGKFKGAKLKMDDKDLTSDLGDYGDEFDDFI